MVAWKKDWFDTVISPDDFQTEVPYENASSSTQQRRKRKHVDENPSSFIQGSAALDYEDQDYSEAAQVLREIHKNPELGPQLLNLVKKIKAGKDDDSIVPTLKVLAIKYASNVLGNCLLIILHQMTRNQLIISCKSSFEVFFIFDNATIKFQFSMAWLCCLWSIIAFSNHSNHV